MAATEAQKAYSRGYHRGRSRMYDHIRKIIAIAKGYRQAARGEWPCESVCQNCSRWSRGPNGAQWGICNAKFEWGIEPRMWADGKSEITTQPDFGCVSWIPSPTDTGSVT